MRAITQDSHAVSQAEDLFETVRDVEDGYTLRLEQPDDLEQRLSLGLVER